MSVIKDDKLSEISGGETTITGTLLSAVGDVLKLLYDVGHAVGSSIRRLADNDLCPIE